MYRFAALGALCLLLGGCVYYPYSYGNGYGDGYGPRYRYAPPAYGYPPPAYPYGAYPAQPNYPRTLGPNGDTAGSTGG
jgi:hypothetical protein